MATRVPPHEIGKVQGDSTNRNHLAKKSKFICPIRPEATDACLYCNGPARRRHAYFTDYQLIKIIVQIKVGSFRIRLLSIVVFWESIVISAMA